MANTFLKARGMDVGASLAEDGSLEAAREIMSLAASGRGTLCFDRRDCGREDCRRHPHGDGRSSAPVPQGYAIADSGPKTVRLSAKG